MAQMAETMGVPEDMAEVSAEQTEDPTEDPGSGQVGGLEVDRVAVDRLGQALLGRVVRALVARDRRRHRLTRIPSFW